MGQVKVYSNTHTSIQLERKWLVLSFAPVLEQSIYNSKYVVLD